MTRRLFFIGAVLALAACTSTKVPTADGGDTLTVIYLVRHAEKQTGTDPSLTVAGQERAALLARELSDAGLTHIHSTEYRRTRETAMPVAQFTGLPVSLYDPRDLPGFAARLTEEPGTHLVVGHSNTTPALVAALGGEPGTPIYEKSEYDRLYVVTIPAEGAVATELRRYGAAYIPE
ncbi:histidine phosphatase family protein [Parvularcula sp. IMCC14364]|uniref:SixA phosphatase family protein n=1 Tax=Parvularcula sp. IMCC14364 TaxID=3067902 RepID=UPI0027416F2F|nr:histidine phosphatase family protein [Parvularcula sp. IMCC14364]